ncbi:MAG: sigma-70 family RNA polymerase sigma factor [Candidatus Enteromonas sp.]|nr:sigma-70 family RNA polymerase sigma factor [Candidatus Enteromonas sp.]
MAKSPSSKKTGKTENPTGEESFSRGFSSFSEFPAPTAEEEIALLETIRGKSISPGSTTSSEISEAKQYLIEKYYPLVVRIASDYHRSCGFPLSDLVLAGNFGLIGAMDTYDMTSQTRFLTYAYSCVENAIRDFLRRQVAGGYVPFKRYSSATRVRVAIERLQEMGIAQPSAEQIAMFSGLRYRTVQKALQSRKNGLIPEKTAKKTTEQLVIRFLQIRSIFPSKAQQDKGLDRKMESALRALPELDYEILSLAYGIKSGRCFNNAQIGRMLGVSRERVRQIRMRAVFRMVQIVEGKP